MHWRGEPLPYLLWYKKSARIVIWVPGPPLLKIHYVFFVREVWSFFVVHHDCIHVAPGDRLVIIWFLLIEQFRFLLCLFCFEQLRFRSYCSISVDCWDPSNLRWFFAFADNGDFTLRRLRRRLGDRRCLVTRKIIVGWWNFWFFILRGTGTLGFFLSLSPSSLSVSLGFGSFSGCLSLHGFLWDSFFLYFAVF